MHSAGKPAWQQLTALVSLGASGAVTGLTFSPHTPADLTSPASLPVHLMALAKAAKPAAADDVPLRSAIVNFAQLFLRMARGKTPAQMESIIWQHDSVDGIDHGQSCAAFASLTLELAAQAVGQHSWVTGGTSYPWPLHKWVDARVEPNPASPGITSVLQDAQAHHRWHQLGDGYRPLPGDWVLFPGHIEVVTRSAGGVLDTIGGDSLPNFSVNAHQYHEPLHAIGVTGFVNNGLSRAGPGGQPGARHRDHRAGRPRPSAPAHSTDPPAAAVGPAAVAGPPVMAGAAAVAGPPGGDPAGTAATALNGRPAARPPAGAAVTGSPAARRAANARPAAGERATTVGSGAARTGPAVPAAGVVIPGLPAPGPAARQRQADRRLPHPANGHGHPGRRSGPASQPNTSAAAPAKTGVSAEPVFPALGLAGPGSAPLSPSPPATAPIPGLPIAPLRLAVGPAHRRHHPPPASHAVPETPAQQAFISQIAAGAIAAQRRYGVPASVTIAQAIVESGWGQSQLASQDHNLFGIKGTGPAGSVQEPSWEYLNGQSVLQNSSFRVYRNAAESIDDHGRLLATSEYYRRTMSYRRDPNAFASSLTGIYATDPAYGTTLISLMRRYNLYRYDQLAPEAAPQPAHAAGEPVAGPVPPVTPAAPVATPAAAPPVRSPIATSPPVTGPGLAASQPAAPGPAVGPQPVVTSSAGPGPLPRMALPSRPASAAPATPGPVVTFPDFREAAHSQLGNRAAAPTWPASHGSARGRPGSHAPVRLRPVGHASARFRPVSNGPARVRPGGQAPASTGRDPRAPASSGLARAQPAAGRPPAPRPAARRSASPRPASQPAASLRPGGVPPVSAPPAAMPSAGVNGTSKAGPAAAPVVVPRPAGPRRRSAPNRRPAQPVGTTAAMITPAIQYRHHIPLPVRHAFTATARATLVRYEPLYRDVARDTGIDWRLLAACDWMQCEAHPRHSPVRGERLGTANPDGTVYRTKSEALAQCSLELVELAMTVYGIDLTSPAGLSVRDLASTFAAFRWGGLLRAHRTSAMEFPYSVAGLTDQHTNMRWPAIADPNTPDKPGSRFRKPFGAVPIVLSLDLPVTV